MNNDIKPLRRVVALQRGFWVSCLHCGEQLSWGDEPVYIKGLPPRMRGTVEQAITDFVKTGITPAYAGNRRAAGSCDRRAGSPLRMQGIDYIAVS